MQKYALPTLLMVTHRARRPGRGTPHRYAGPEHCSRAADASAAAFTPAVTDESIGKVVCQVDGPMLVNGPESLWCGMPVTPIPDSCRHGVR